MTDRTPIEGTSFPTSAISQKEVYLRLIAAKKLRASFVCLRNILTILKEKKLPTALFAHFMISKAIRINSLLLSFQFEFIKLMIMFCLSLVFFSIVPPLLIPITSKKNVLLPETSPSHQLIDTGFGLIQFRIIRQKGVFGIRYAA